MISKREPSSRLNVDDKGFTLIEIMISMMVIAIAVLALTKLNANTWSSIGLSKSHTEASALAVRTLETLFSEKYASDQTSGMSALLTTGIHPFTSADGYYQVTYEIRDSDILPDTKTVQMNVSFNQGARVINTRFNYLLPLRR